MLIGLGIEAESGVDQVVASLLAIDEKTKKYFESKSYGKGVQNIFIGLIIISREGKGLHPQRKIKYKKTEKIFYPDGSNKIIMNVLSFDTIIDYEMLRQMTESQALTYISGRIIQETRSSLLSDASRFGDFNTTSFLADLQLCLESSAEKWVVQPTNIMEEGRK